MPDDWRYEPAKDLHLPAQQALRSVVREPGLIGATMTQAWWLVASAYLHVRQTLRIEGRQHLPRETPFVLVANHSSHFDALVLGAAVRTGLRHRVFPIAAGDTFFVKPAASVLSAMMLNALPMWRRNCGAHALQTLRDRLLDGRTAYILFPEGTRSRDGAMGAFKPGVGMLLADTDVPVVPAHITGAFDAWPADRKRPRPGRIRVRLGEDDLPRRPIRAELLATFEPFNRETWTSADITDMTFDDAGRLYVVCARPARVHRFTPNPAAMYDGRTSMPWLHLAESIGAPATKAENVLAHDGWLYITTGNGYEYQAGAAGTVYRVPVDGCD